MLPVQDTLEKRGPGRSLGCVLGAEPLGDGVTPGELTVSGEEGQSQVTVTE